MVHAGSGMATGDFGSESPPPPALPPRRYRGEMDLTMVDRLPSTAHQGVAQSARCMDTTNGESTLPHNTYANQLRRQAQRYQRTRGSSFSHPRPPPPDWKPPPPPPYLPQDLPPSDNTSSTRRSLESEVQKSRAEDAFSSTRVSESEACKSRVALTSSFNNYSPESEVPKSSARTAVPEFETRTAGMSLLTPGNKTTEVRQTTPNMSQSPPDNSFDSNYTGDQRLTGTSPVTYPEVDVVSGYDRYYRIGDRVTSLSYSFSSFSPSNSHSSEVLSARRSSQPAVQLASQPRHSSHPTETSTQNAESSPVEQPTCSSAFSIYTGHALPVDQKAALTSDAGLPTGRTHLNTDVEIRPETAPSSRDTESSSKVEEEEQSLPEVIEPSLTELKFFRRKKFPAEVDCVRQAEVVAGLLRRLERDEALVSILVPSTGHRTATDFMAKVLGVVESEQQCYDDLPESLRLRLSERDARHAAL